MHEIVYTYNNHLCQNLLHSDYNTLDSVLYLHSSILGLALGLGQCYHDFYAQNFSYNFCSYEFCF